MHVRTLASLLFLSLLSPLNSGAQTAPNREQFRDPLNVQPVDKVSSRVDDTRRVRLAHQVHPWATAENMVGEVLPSQPMNRMVIVLRPDPAQDEALEELIQAQQDPASPYYHQWLTPDTFAEHFGASQDDLYQVSSWIEMQGMKVDEIPSSHRAIIFSGTAGQVEAAFHTQMRKYSVRGQMHFANATDPEIPQALANVIKGIVSLHDFRSAAQHTVMPAYTAANGAHFLMPGDWSAIYDVTPLYSQGLDGSGQSIAIVGRQDISLTDVRTFRTNAGLPANDPQVTVVNGVDPGFTDCSDEEEAALDVEWAGAIAKKATIKYINAASGATDGVVLAAQYAVAHNVAPIVSVSYLHCENTLSDGGQSLWGNLWAQAAAQGQTILVASGDTGAAGCDAATQKTATQGVAVNAICSTPNSTCVGGTEFNDSQNPGVYWSAANGPGGTSVLGYIPESAWNETAWSGMLGTASGGGVSTIYAKPSWQSAPGVPAGAKRYVPDISATSAINDAYVIQIQGGVFYAGGTSAATPSLASVMALVMQNTGGPLGNVNPALYTLATQQASGGPKVFHDITSGNNSVPGVSGYSAGQGYDLATGLGSVDAFLLVNSWRNSSASNFTLGSNTASLAVSANGSATATLTLSALGGFNSPVTLSAAGAPAGVTVTFSSPSVTAAAPVTMTVSASANVQASTSQIVVTGTGGGFNRTLAFTLTVAAPYFTLTPNPTGASVNVGSSVTFSVAIAKFNGFNSAVALTVSGVPQGVTASFSPATITSGNSSILTVSVASGTAAGTIALGITGTSGSITQTQSISLAVANSNYTLTASAASASLAPGGSVPVTITTTAGAGFNSIVYLSVSGLPSGVTASLSKTSIPAPGNGTSALTLSAAASVAPGTYPLTLGAVGGNADKTLAFSLTILSSAMFTLNANTNAVSVTPGGSTPATFTTSAGAGFNSAIALSVSGAPSGVSASFAPASIPAPGNGSSTLTLSAGSTSSPGVSSLTITAVGGGMTRSQTLSVTVLPVFTLTSSVSSTSLTRGGSLSMTVATSPGTGFNSAISLTAGGVPTGVTASFSSPSIAAPGSGNRTLTLNAGPTAAAGTFTLSITATGGGITRTQTLSLTVLAPTLTLALGATAVNLMPGGSLPTPVSTSGSNGFNWPLALAVSGIPSGVTATLAPAAIAAPGRGTSTLTVTAATTAAPGTSTLTLTATGGGLTQTQTLRLTILPTFTLSLSAPNATVARGASTSISLTTTVGAGFNSAISISSSATAAGVSASFSPASIAAPGKGNSVLTLSASATATTGTSTVVVTATGAGITKTQALSLTVTPVFSLSAGAATASLGPGGSTPITFITTPGTGFNAPITLSATGLPAGITASFAPAAVAAPGNGAGTVTFWAASTALAGVYNLTVTAVGGGITRTQAVAVTVLPPTFTLARAANSTSASVVSGKSTVVVLSTAGLYRFSSAIALSVSGAPKGVTTTLSPSTIPLPGTGNANLTVTAASGMAATSFTLTVTATGGGVTRTLPTSLTFSTH